MVLFPEAQARAQAEIDAVVGFDRLPAVEEFVCSLTIPIGILSSFGLSSKKALPYVDALIQEIFRWEAIAPTGVARRLAQDDEYRGLFIAKDSIIIPNIW